jgi:hypothetical protein
MRERERARERERERERGRIVCRRRSRPKVEEIIDPISPSPANLSFMNARTASTEVGEKRHLTTEEKVF